MATSSPDIQTEQPQPPPDVAQTQAMLAQTLGVIAAIAGLTAVRLLLLLAVVGAFYLATIAANNPIGAALYVLVAYCVLIVLPLVWLESGRSIR